jgi:hypothetical protein
MLKFAKLNQKQRKQLKRKPPNPLQSLMLKDESTERHRGSI